METVVQVVDLFKSYREGEVSADVIKGISFTIDRGEFVAIRGPSGAGKSTLLNLLGALDVPDQGQVTVAGETLAADSGKRSDTLTAFRRDKIGFIFQNHYLMGDFSVLENVMFPLLIQSVPREIAEVKATAVLNRIGLGHRLHHFPSQISGGESQRVAVARAVVKNPPLVLADEPTGNLDSENREKFIEILNTLQREDGLTVVVVTHEAELAMRANRQIHMVDGKIVQ